MLQNRQLSAIMFTDIRGYTALMQQDEEHAIEIRNRHREVFNSLNKKYNGELINYFGDGTLSIFKSSIEAIKCGIEMQKEFQKEPHIPVRIGVHLGDIIRTESDIIGDAVNIASRIESLGVAGSVLLSDKVNEQLKNQRGIKTQLLDTFEFKNVNDPIPIFAIANEGVVIPKLSEIKGKTKDIETASVTPSSMKNYFGELRRRNVIKSGLAYVVIAWLLMQVSVFAFPYFNVPQYISQSLLFVLAVGFPFWLAFSWVYEITPGGLRKTVNINPEESIGKQTNTKLNRIIISGLSIGVVVMVINIFGINQTIMDSFEKNISTPIIEDTNKSIAVLAFADMSPEKNQEYFSDGISEEILNLLTKINDLKVISRTSSFSFKDKDVTTTEIGTKLNVNHILEGSVRKFGNTFRITTQLIDVSDGTQVWSETYDRPMDSIFKIQDEIANMVTGQLQLTLLGVSNKNSTANSEAYTLYLKAKHLSHQTNKASQIEAENIVKESIAIDSLYAPAWSLLSDIYHTGSYNFLIRPLTEGIDLGITAAQKAIELDPEYALAYSNLASLQLLAWDFETADENMNKALDLDPGNSVIIGTIALKQFGNLDEGIKLLKKAIVLDPLIYANYYNLGYFNWQANNLDEADEALNTFAFYYPEASAYHYIKAQILISRNQYEDALIEAEKEPNAFFNLYGRTFTLFALGRTEEADAVLKEIVDTYGETEATNMADIYAFRGDADKAFFWLNKAIKIKDPVLLESLNYPSFKNLHKDRRWKSFINRIGLPENHGVPLE
ncbi:MAG: adenylate/guanylate cyclase domain-containing protein [Psychroserpens sp.]|uniref:adenylate/guanylate cyclase domain-containing protein n=1 Tax=Psychroserpens sp. TaxID=2020870 RepID=UPI0030024D51